MLQKLSRAFLPVLLMAVFPLAVSAQGVRNVEGTVVDETTGEPLLGVTVVVRDTQSGTSTGPDGSFSLRVPAGGHTLEFRFIGYQTREVSLGTASRIEVKLAPDVTGIDEVVVVGYGTQKKVNLTGSISTIDSDDISRRPVMRASSALQGLSAGVSVVQNSGQPGSDGSTIRIRGVGTFNNAEALVLIDGVEGNMDGLDVNDIENISILKDAASSAIYGSRAANGVILVTTKAGQKGRMKVSYDGYVGLQRFTDLPEFVDGYTYMEAMNLASKNNGGSEVYDATYLANYKRYKNIDPDNYPDTDWQKAVYTGSGLTHHHHLSVSGGQQVLVHGSFSYQDQDGLIPNFGSERFSARLNTKMDIKKWLSAAISVEGRSSTVSYPMQQSSIKSAVNRTPPVYVSKLTDGRWGTGYNGHNPAAYANDGGMRDNVYNYIRATFNLTVKPFDGAAIDFNYSPKFNYTSVKAFSKSISTYEPGRESPAYTNPTKSLESLTRAETRVTENMLNLVARYNKTFGDHEVGVLFGYEHIYSPEYYVNAKREGFPLNDYQELNAGSSVNQTNSGYTNDWGLVSQFNRVNYSYKSRYLFEANVRFDWSSRFAKGYKMGVFPSVSAGWRISEEPFMKNVRWVSNLKLRGSWGILGNQQTNGYYPAYSTISINEKYAFGETAQQAAVQSKYSNPKLKWESTRTYDIGLDASFFNGKLGFSFEFYDRYTYDILMNLPIELEKGMTAPVQNAGQVRNTGWDLTVNYRDRKGDFSWSVDFNLSDVRNEILHLRGEMIKSGFTIQQEGYPINSLYGYKATGLFRDWDEVSGSPTQKLDGTISPGDIKYANMVNEAGEDAEYITAADRTVIGNQIPRYIFGLNINAAWKNLDLTLFFQGVGKKDVILTGDTVWALYNAGKMQTWHQDYWTESNPGASYPRLISASTHNNFANSSFWVWSAAYFRLKTAQIGYTLPKRLTDKIRMDKLRVYVTGDNVFTLDRMPKGWDPETRSGDAELYPITSTYLLGLQITF